MMPDLLRDHLVELLLACAAGALMLGAALRLPFRAAGWASALLLLLAGGWAVRNARLRLDDSAQPAPAVVYSAVASGARPLLTPGAAPADAAREPLTTARDAWGWWFCAMIFLSGAAAAALATRHLPRKGCAAVEFFALLLFAALGFSLLARSADFVTLFLGLETGSLSLYGLVATLRDRPKSLEAAFKYFILGAAAAALLLFGVALLYGATGRFDFSGVFAALGAGSAAPVLGAAGALLVFTGVAFKLALAPFHAWAPDAYSGAPTPVSAFMMTATKAGMLGAAVRLALAARHAPRHAGLISAAVLALALLTLLTGNTIALTQRRFKRWVGYIAIASSGFTALALALLAAPPPPSGDTLALIAWQQRRDAIAGSLVFYLVGYLLSTFGLLAALMQVEGDAHLDAELKEFTGVGRMRPLFGASLAVLLFSGAGLPGTAGFLGKFFILRELVFAGRPVAAAIAILLTLAAAGYYLKLLVILYMRPRDPDEPLLPWRTGPESLLIALCAALTLLLGFWPSLGGWFPLP